MTTPVTVNEKKNLFAGFNELSAEAQRMCMDFKLFDEP